MFFCLGSALIIVALCFAAFGWKHLVVMSNPGAEFLQQTRAHPCSAQAENKDREGAMWEEPAGDSPKTKARRMTIPLNLTGK
jgi:hypothetical protein